MDLLHFTEIWEKTTDICKSYQGLYVDKLLLLWAEETRNCLHVNEEVMSIHSKLVLIISDGLFLVESVLSISFDSFSG